MKILVLIIFSILVSCKSKIVKSDVFPISDKVTTHNSSLNEENKENIKIETQIPQCIAKRIEKIKSGIISNPPTVVTEYTVNEKKYYLIPADCCDQYDYIIDENCKIVCNEGVGFDGKYINTCKNTLKNATTKVIWRDLR